MRKSILDALFLKTRQAILEACLLHPEKWWYLSSLSRHVKLSPSSLQLELASLAGAGLLESRRDGNRIYYRANSECPILSELQILFVKTRGVADVLRHALKGFVSNIDVAFIYGSIARGEELATSDVDLMIVGNLKLADLASVLPRAEKALGREVNPTIYSLKEFREKIKKSDGFLKTVIAGKKIFLKGSSGEIKEIFG